MHAMPPRRRRTLAPETVKLNVDEVRDAIARAGRKQAALVVLQGSESEIGTHVLLDRPVTIGRDPKIELPLQDEGISRRHCRVFNDKDKEQFVVEDLNSTNGTLLNGKRVSGKARLEPGDRIFLGACVVKFTWSDELEVGYHAQMDALVGTDDLTGLIAKRRFDAAFARAVDDARLTRSALAVMMLDLDGLKLINDTHGHPVGAYTIAEVGKLIGRVISPRGAACRFGGDEFAAYLPGVSKREAKQLGEAIRALVAGHRFDKEGAVVKPTISIGVSVFPDDGATAERLLRRADEALYRAKKGGRDRGRDVKSARRSNFFRRAADIGVVVGGGGPAKRSAARRSRPQRQRASVATRLASPGLPHRASTCATAAR
jgi:diguanylate cyclase (GGDEF)-like protein